MTIEQLASKTGLSKPYISQVETGKASPSLQTLEKLATALAVPMSSLFVDPEVACEVIRQSDRQVVVVGTLDGPTQKRVEILSAPNRQLEMLVVEIPVGNTAGGASHSHDGEEAHWLLDGRLRVTHGGRTLIIEAGDSFHWDATVPHRVENIGDRPARLVVARIPPGFLDVAVYDEDPPSGSANL